MIEKEKLTVIFNFSNFLIDHDISDMVLHVMDLASKIKDVNFSDDQIDGGT